MEQRLHILYQGNVIDEDIYRGMLQVIEQLEHTQQLLQRNEQGWMVIAHMANALMRSRQQQQVEPIDNAILQEIEQQGELAALAALNQQLLNLFPVTLHPNEQGYLLANLYALKMAQAE
ncbi:MAG: PRD domain-containing protein [Enterobacteriaceae bacterium]